MCWLQSVELLAISVVTLEEADFGLAWQPNARKLALFNAMVQRLHAFFPITPSIAQRGGVLHGQFRPKASSAAPPTC